MLRSLLFTCLLASAAQAAPVPQYVWVHPATTDMYAMTVVFTTGRPMEHFDRITGRTGLMPMSLPIKDQARLVTFLDGVGAMTCDSLVGDSKVWEITRIDTTQSGGLRKGASRRVTYGALRCAALAAMKTVPDTSRIFYAYRQLSAIQPVPRAREDLPVLSSSYQAFNAWQRKKDLIKEAEDLNNTRDWSRVGFAVWTARSAGGRGVRLTAGAMPALVDDPIAPVDVRVHPRVLREVTAHFLDRREIEIASHFPVDQAQREGVNGWAGAVECDSLRNRTWVVFGSHVLPSEGVMFGRELVEYLSVRDRKASQAVSEALALTEAKEARKPPPLSLRGPVPYAIRVSPTTGEDLARTLVVARVGAPDSLFAGPVRFVPDPELTLRGLAFKTHVGDRSMSAIAAQLDQVAIDDGAPCDSVPPAWPPTWHVRFYGDDGRVMREFDVPVRLVRCRARERFDAIGRNGDYEMRSAMETLVRLGVDEWAPEGPYDPPPQRLAPEAQRAAYLQGPVESLGLSLVGSNRAMLRLAVGSVTPSRDGASAPVYLGKESMRVALTAALSHPAFIAGMAHTPSEVFRRQHPHAEIRVFEKFPGLRNPVLRLIAYVSPAEAAEITQRILAAVDPSESGAIRAHIAGTDR